MKNKIKKILFERPYSESIKILRQYLTGKFINLTVIKSLKDLESDRKQLIFYNKYIGKNKLIFDIGANIGDKTNLFLKLGCKVIAVEPQSDLANRLRIKYTNNKNVAVERCGIGKEDGEAEINISTKYPGFSSFIKTWQQGTKYHTFEKTEKVKITTLDKLISKYGIPYFCKIDVEGFEYEVLSGLSKKIPLINFEFHTDDKQHTERCVSKLQSIGFTEFNFVIAADSKMASLYWLNAEHLLSEIEKKHANNQPIYYGDVYAK